MTESKLDIYFCLDCRDTGFVVCEHCIGHGVVTELSDTLPLDHYELKECTPCGGKGYIRCYCGQCQTPSANG